MSTLFELARDLPKTLAENARTAPGDTLEAGKGILGRMVSEIGQTLWEEAKFAVTDIRQKGIEKPWFGEVTTPKTVNHHHDLYAAAKEGKEVSREDLYGKDAEHDQAHEHSRER